MIKHDKLQDGDGSDKLKLPRSPALMLLNPSRCPKRTFQDPKRKHGTDTPPTQEWPWGVFRLFRRLSNEYVFESCHWLVQQASGIQILVAPTDEVATAATEEVPLSEVDARKAARSTAKAANRAMFDQEEIAKGKRKLQEGTSKETLAERKSRLKESEVKNERWSPTWLDDSTTDALANIPREVIELS
ncbi:hypothetical protein KSP39_PZI022168 [Platanthera zijinensis]|uniref:Uncharacterized protein n=1 Tax=Platanthera zijinensis TaxID=2320716 RepID=A0AAP0AUS4_9ASPA